MNAIILAAGKGERMKSTIPKPFIAVGGVPMIIRLLMTLENLSILSNIYIVVAENNVELFKKEIQRYLPGLLFHIIPQHPIDGYGTGAALQAFLRVQNYDIDKTCDYLILNSDSPFLRKETIEAMKLEKTMFSNDLLVGTGFLDDPNGYGRMVSNEKGVYSIVEEKELRENQQVNHVNGGVYLISPEVLLRGKDIEPCPPPIQEKKITDLLTFSKKPGIFSDMDSFEILNINTPLDKNFAEFLFLTRYKK